LRSCGVSLIGFLVFIVRTHSGACYS